jgi:hypothetical protein
MLGRSGTRALGALAIVVAVVALWASTRQPADHYLLWGRWGVVSAILCIAFTGLAGAALYVWLGPGRRRARIIGIGVLTMTSGLCLLMLELPTLVLGYDYGRIFGRGTGDTWLDLSAGVNQADPELIHIHWPHSEYRGEVVGNLVGLGIPTETRYPVDLRYDQNGFRNDTDLERAQVAVVGDSFVEAALVASEQTVSSQVGKKLGVVAANLGQSAYGLRQELVVLERYALPLEPEWVVWFFFGGNGLRDVQYYEHDRAHFGEQHPRRALKQRSLVYNALFALSSATTLASGEPREGARDRSAVYPLGPEGPQTMYFGGETPPWTDHDWQVAVHTLREARRMTEAAGARFLLVYIPRKFTVYADLVESPPDRMIAGWEVLKLHALLGEWAGSVGIDYVDLVAPLREAAAAGDSPYLVDDVHWNERGHELAAEHVAEFIRGH